MVQAILEGRKSQTRRIVKGQALIWLDDSGFTPEFVASGENELCPYGQPGDVLWVRESYSPDYFRQGEHGYKVDWTELSKEYMPAPKWKPSIHMPRSACRIFLKVENVRVERLHKISEADALNEGIKFDKDSGYHFVGDIIMEQSATHCFHKLWDMINGTRASWESNPWVWVIEFSRRE